ncbi:MAG: dUTP diphosphatase [Candidatus Pelagibacterales bacterium]|jgi:dUTP pyrophosphatase|nr:MAG: dUTP diphosphatase [Pelagibacterales bacterium]
MIKVLIKKLNQKAIIPSYKTSGSSGLDLTALIESEIIIPSKKSALISTGLSIAIPEDTEVQIRPRSGLAAKSNITVLNTPGTIDSDYRGELKIILFNHGDKEFVVNNGDRIAQMVLMPILKIEFEEVDNLPKTIRGSGGFGSTGK